MALHSISEAHRLTGKARSTIRRDLKSGDLSATTRPDGARAIDTAELVRVYGSLQKLQDQNSTELHSEPGGEVERNPAIEDLHRRLSEAEARAARAEGERDILRELADHVRQDASAWRERANKADQLLLDFRTSSESKEAGPWWRFRRKSQ